MIYLIGDGMGLSQIVAAFYANKGLSTLQMKYIGLQQNNALDAFTTDSAPAAAPWPRANVTITAISR